MKRGIGAIYDSLPKNKITSNLIDDIASNSGWRSLFDPHSTEWGMSTMATKFNLLRRVLDAGTLSLRQIINKYKEEYDGRPDIKCSVEIAVSEILEWGLRNAR